MYELEKKKVILLKKSLINTLVRDKQLLIIVATILFNVFGIFVFDWTFNEMSANFLLAGIVAGLVSGLGLNGTFDALIEGMQNILFGAMIVGFAKGIVVILENGKIIDTIVHGMTTLLSDIPASFVIIAMFILQFLLNFFIPSGSGQALTTMPLMVPISDLLHINRQLTVLAFNMVIQSVTFYSQLQQS